MAKYSFGGREFSTKKEITETIRDYLDAALGVEYKPGSSCYLLLFDLLSQTNTLYAKRYGGVSSFIVDYNEWGNKVFEIIRPNGRRDTFSSSNCIKSIGNSYKTNVERSVREQRLSAYRIAILPQINAFRSLPYQGVCTICFKQMDRNTYRHVDHIILFKHLVKKFEEEVSLQLPTKFDRTTSVTKRESKTKYLVIFKEEDADFKDSWFDFHERNSQLRVVCDHCNENREYGKPIDTEGIVPPKYKGHGVYYNHWSGYLNVYDYEDLAYALNYGRGFTLNLWESQFVSSIRRQQHRGYDLSDKQERVLNRMALHIVSNPYFKWQSEVDIEEAEDVVAFEAENDEDFDYYDDEDDYCWDDT